MKKTIFTLLERNDNDGDCFAEILEIGFDSVESVKTAIAAARNFSEDSFTVRKIEGYMIEESDEDSGEDELAEELDLEMYNICKFQGNKYIYDTEQFSKEDQTFGQDVIEIANKFEYPLDVAAEWNLNKSLFGVEFFKGANIENAYKSLKRAYEKLIEELMEDASGEEYDSFEKIRFFEGSNDEVKSFIENHKDQIVNAMR